MNSMIVGRALASTLTALVVLMAGCSAGVDETPDPTPPRPTKTPSAIMRPANAGERIHLARVGLLQIDAEALAVDLGAGRSLVSGILEHPGERPTYPAMVLVYAEHWAYVGCDWDGSKAIGVDVGKTKAGEAIRATIDYFGTDICEPWIRLPEPWPPRPASR